MSVLLKAKEDLEVNQRNLKVCKLSQGWCAKDIAVIDENGQVYTGTQSRKLSIVHSLANINIVDSVFLSDTGNVYTCGNNQNNRNLVHTSMG